MPGFGVGPYEPADREAYLGLLREAWGERATSGDEFDWWLGRNPAGSIISVARMDGRVVGAAAHSLLPMVVDGERATASWSQMRPASWASRASPSEEPTDTPPAVGDGRGILCL